jgi:4-hydroxybenzoate polyprenyltransferase
LSLLKQIAATGEAFLFSNLFYGFAAILLAIEHHMVMNLPLPAPAFYMMLGAGTTVFYLYSYTFDPHPMPHNQRTVFLQRNGRLLSYLALALMVAFLAAGIWFYRVMPPLPAAQAWLITIGLLVFPILGLLYYGISFPGIFTLRLRSLGWLKPFVIAAVWMGCTNIVPWLISSWQAGKVAAPAHPMLFWWLHNWMYISVLCILFDIKDYEADHNHDLKTFVVRHGIEKTLHQVVYPLTGAGMAALLLMGITEEYSLLAIAVLLLPLALLGWVSSHLQRPKPIGFYLLVIDGLMPVKALAGMLAAVL